jgi:hypothetical protein
MPHFLGRIHAPQDGDAVSQVLNLKNITSRHPCRWRNYGSPKQCFRAHPCAPGRRCSFSGVELEKHYSAVLHDIVPAFLPVFARFLYLCLGSIGKDVITMVHFGLDKAFLKIGMDDPGGFGGGVS